MGTITDKLNKLAETKSAIKTAIVNKGVAVSDSDTFASYADKIASIEGGSTPTEGIYGVFIYDTNGNLTKPEEWNTANNDLAVGVAVIDENCAFIIDKVGTSSTYQWGDTGTVIDGVSTSDLVAYYDYFGESNTDAIITKYPSGSFAANYCRGRSCTVNGTTLYGYLGAYGEWKTAYNNKSSIDNALSKIGGTAINTSDHHWTSTQDSADKVWILGWGNGGIISSTKDSDSYVRAFYPMDYPKGNKTKYKTLIIDRPNYHITKNDFDKIISVNNGYPTFDNVEYNHSGSVLENLYTSTDNGISPSGTLTINAEDCAKMSTIFNTTNNVSFKDALKPLNLHINSSSKLESLDNFMGDLPFYGNITISDTSNVTNFSHAFSNCKNKEFKELDTSSATNLNYILYSTNRTLIKIASISLKSLDITISYGYFTGYSNMINLRYVLLKDFGTGSNCTSASFTYWDVWGVEDETVPLSAGARQSLIDTLITYSYDRATAGYSTCTVNLSANTKALLTQDEIAQMTAKGYTLA